MKTKIPPSVRQHRQPIEKLTTSNATKSQPHLNQYLNCKEWGSPNFNLWDYPTLIGRLPLLDASLFQILVDPIASA